MVVVLMLATPAGKASSETTVHHVPGHPMADAAGYMLSLRVAAGSVDLTIRSYLTLSHGALAELGRL